MKNKIYFFLVLAIAFSLPLMGESQVVTRAAFDLGSGQFKLLVGDVIGQKVHVKLSKRIDVHLGNDYNESTNGMLSDRVKEVARQAMRDLVSDATRAGATEFSGIATATFRKAKNGDQLLKQLIEESGVPLVVISQEVEGELGFKTGVALFPEFDEKDIVVFDLGNASFQLSTAGNVYNGPIGMSDVSKMLSEEIRHIPYSKENPAQLVPLADIFLLVEMIQSKLPPAPWLINKMVNENGHAVYFDYASWMDELRLLSGANRQMTKEQLKDALVQLSAESENPVANKLSTERREYLLTGYALTYAIMCQFNFDTFSLAECETGSALGLMIAPEFWPCKGK